MDEPQKNRLRSYAWGYFAYHADQRMKTFHFYLIMVAALTAGMAALVAKDSPIHPKLPSLLCGAISFLSVMFRLLDRRNARLVKNGEAALRHLDSLEAHARTGETPHVLEIFAWDDEFTRGQGRMHFSYSKVLRTIFWVFGLAGAALAIGLW